MKEHTNLLFTLKITTVKREKEDLSLSDRKINLDRQIGHENLNGLSSKIILFGKKIERVMGIQSFESKNKKNWCF